MLNDQENVFKGKIEFYFANSVKIHIVLKNKEWFNGTIQKVNPDFFVLNESKKGILPIYYSELFDVDPYTPENENKEVKG